MFKKPIRGPIFALFSISLAGLLLHLRIHWPLDQSGEIKALNLVPAVFGAISTFVLPFMFNNKKAVGWAYLINLAAVIVGVVSMAYYSYKNPPEQITIFTIILQTTLADILILLAKLPLASMILRYWRHGTTYSR